MTTDIDLVERYAMAQALNSPIRSGHTGIVIPAVLVQISIRPKLIGVRPVPDAMDIGTVSATGFTSIGMLATWKWGLNSTRIWRAWKL